MFKYGVIAGSYFNVLGLNLSVFSPNTGKYGPEITPYLDTSHVVLDSFTNILWWNIPTVHRYWMIMLTGIVENKIYADRQVPDSKAYAY